MNATAKHRADDAVELPINRVVPLPWLVTILCAGAAGFSGLAMMVQGMSRDIEKLAVAQEKSAAVLTAKVDKLSNDATAGGLTLKGYEFEISDLKRRVSALESKR